MAINLKVFLPLPIVDVTDVGYTCRKLCQSICSDDVNVSLFTPLVRGIENEKFIYPAMPRSLSFIPNRIAIKLTKKYQKYLFQKKLDGKSVAYLWSNIDINFIKQIKKKMPIIYEVVNCEMGFSKEKLDAEYKRLGLKCNHPLTDQMVSLQREKLSIADYIFCSNPRQAETFAMLPKIYKNIKLFHYGCDIAENMNSRKVEKKEKKFTLLFVGTASVGKGVHRLLEAWDKANVKGNLLIAGSWEKELRYAFRHILERGDVVPMGYVKNIHEVYSMADAFAFPSFGEGGPLVTYEMAMHRLPSILSPMGAGEILRNNKETIIVEPENTDGWVEAIKMMANSFELREKLGLAAYKRIQKYTWQIAGYKRRKEIKKLFG